MQTAINPSFAAWIKQKRRLPYTSWGDFLRVTLKSGELDVVLSSSDLLRLLTKTRFDGALADAKHAWIHYRRWSINNGHSDPNEKNDAFTLARE